MNGNNVDSNRLESLLKITADRLGSTPEALKKAAKDGSLADMLGNVQGSEGAAIQKVLSDPDAAKKLLATPQAQKLLQMLQGGKQ